MAEGDEETFNADDLAALIESAGDTVNQFEVRCVYCSVPLWWLAVKVQCLSPCHHNRFSSRSMSAATYFLLTQ